MSSLSAQVARAHARWLEPRDPRYTRDDIDAKCREINSLLEEFASQWCASVEESGEVDDTIIAAEDLIKNLRSLSEDLEEIENNQDPRQERYL
ncbi:hypothetical protein ACKUB1_09675 [Methanospirillum stamsii]|uniref:Uncharacterized protein n=1 Tax=Methanospirillum stamsii TaxID=1277351 RepID=A0A2V2N5L6_9EURY|nr:hypothetical protein [Methanospirillum stamsii]PWR75362.1 hypothetical protein DLD82_04295 [Methanospirillum stamsii]